MTSAPKSPPACVICGRPVEAAFRPFCSLRCADLDLRRWLTGGYVIPGDVDDEGAEPPPPDDDEV
jgi:endogenous inhibitor of DNA gyrase (YacG/DUF329 family)